MSDKMFIVVVVVLSIVSVVGSVMSISNEGIPGLGLFALTALNVLFIFFFTKKSDQPEANKAHFKKLSKLWISAAILSFIAGIAQIIAVFA